METIMMPTRIARLSRYHGYPVPWNVLRGTDGTPFFTINDDRRHCRALREKLMWDAFTNDIPNILQRTIRIIQASHLT